MNLESDKRADRNGSPGRVMPAFFDVIIAGGGHAGCEAAMALARLGLKILLVTSNMDRIGHLSCNPAIGGLGKGHMVREIDALGGSMGRWADQAGIQFRILNASKGPAVQAPRAQMDRSAYMLAVQKDIFSHPGIWIVQDFLAAPLMENGRVTGAVTELGRSFKSRALLLTTGTFTKGMLHFGPHRIPGGRSGDAPSASLSPALLDLGLELGRLMTCTTPRLHKDSIDYSVMQEQPGDDPLPQFSFTGPRPPLRQLSCHLTWSTPESHEVIRNALHASPMYNGAIPGPGPRYCPAIEDKIARFPEKQRHQMFIEPEGLDSVEVYPNGMPTGLPVEVQQAFLEKIPGLEKSIIIRPGYAVEYDFIPPTQLHPTLECKSVPGLWSAGQINGSSGYEEAAAQGLWAALNIFASITGAEPFLPGRDRSYIAVLVDDLVTKGTDEPYRMLTSRAEHRLLLRHSNADTRLTPLGRKYGLVNDEHWQSFCASRDEEQKLIAELEERRVTPNAETREVFAGMGENPPGKSMSLAELFRRPGMGPERMAALWPGIMDYSEKARSEAQSALLYSGYLQRQEELARRQGRMEEVSVTGLNYAEVHGLSREEVEKLSKIQPRTLGQASRISGVTPSAIGCIEVHLKKIAGRKNLKKTDNN